MSYDDERFVELEEDAPILPEQTTDDTNRGWREPAYANDERLLEDRPPHWD